jgi:hypothetical protein
MTKIAESGSNSQRHRSADSDPDPDTHQNVMDPQHWLEEVLSFCSVVFCAPPALHSQNAGILLFLLVFHL